jgi:hypothetical protein
MVNCMFCHRGNPPGLRRCPNCGAELPETTAPLMPIDGDLESRVRSLINEGQKNEAIKLYRERTGAGLKEAKDAVEATAARRGIVISQGAGCFGVVIVSLGFLAGGWAVADDRPITISGAQRDRHGLLVHTVESPYQSGRTEIKILTPEKREEDIRFPVVYVLPVEARTGDRYGDGLLEVKRHDLHNRFRAIFVAPTFSHLPWYADHPTNPEIRQECYFLEVVVPFIEGRYPARADRGGRFLLGFSKSGWGAYSLLLRHPDRFGKAAAWDAPLMQGRPDRFGMNEVFGTRENFEEYRITNLLERRAAILQWERRLILLGYGNFRDHHEQAHALMVNQKVPHVYRDGPKREHTWESGWVPEAVRLLLDDEGEER